MAEISEQSQSNVQTEKYLDSIVDTKTLYVLVNIKSFTLAARAPLLEIQAWKKLLQGNDGWQKDPSYLRLDCLNVNQLKELFATLYGSRPFISDEDELLKSIQKFVDKMPIDKTSIERIRQMYVEKYGNEMSGGKQPITQKEGDKKMTTEATQTQTQTAAAPAKPKAKGTKILIREVFADGNTAMSIAEIAEITGKNVSSVTTAISDLRSEKYCKPGAPLNLHKWSDGKYRLTAEPKVEKPAEAAAGAADEVLPQ